MAKEMNMPIDEPAPQKFQLGDRARIKANDRCGKIVGMQYMHDWTIEYFLTMDEGMYCKFPGWMLGKGEGR